MSCDRSGRRWCLYRDWTWTESYLQGRLYHPDHTSSRAPWCSSPRVGGSSAGQCPRAGMSHSRTGSEHHTQGCTGPHISLPSCNGGLYICRCLGSRCLLARPPTPRRPATCKGRSPPSDTLCDQVTIKQKTLDRIQKN